MKSPMEDSLEIKEKLVIPITIHVCFSQLVSRHYMESLQIIIKCLNEINQLEIVLCTNNYWCTTPVEVSS